MLKQPDITISLIIPVFKVSAYVERCLKSVIKQTYNHFECIIVDDVLDNHKDSWRQYKDYASKDAVRDFFFSKTMSFPSSAWNRLISREFIKLQGGK